MGQMAEPIPEERLERRVLAHDIVRAVEEDEESPIATLDKDDIVNETIAAMAQEIRMLEAELERAYGSASPRSDRFDADRRLDMLAQLGAASRGPALVVEPATGVDDMGVRRSPSEVFEEMLRDGPRDGALYPKVFGVSIPVDGQTIESINGGKHRVVAITGNGPTSEANAHVIKLMLDPEHGFAAALREIDALTLPRASGPELDQIGATFNCPRVRIMTSPTTYAIEGDFHYRDRLERRARGE